MTEVIIGLSSALAAVVGVLIWLINQRNKYQGASNRGGDNYRGNYNKEVDAMSLLAQQFTTQVALCNDRFMSIATNMGAINSTLASMEKRAERMETKIDKIISNGKN